MNHILTFDDALIDGELLGAALGDAATWQTWRAVLKAAFGLTLNRDEARAFAAVAGERKPPAQRVRELWAIVGRKGGKSRMAAAIAVYVACFMQHKLSPGERGLVLVLAMSLDQAKVVFGYALAFLQSSRILRKQIASTTASEIRLKNGIVIATHANSFRSIRGRSLVCAIFDEVAFWRDDTTAIPDREVYTAVIPALLTTKGMLIAISSAYRRAGLLYQKHRDHFARDSDDILVVKGSTQAYNLSVDEASIAALRAADPIGASAEWDSSFRSDLEGFLDDAVIDRAINYARPIELPPQPPPTFYRAFTDPSGGSTAGDAYSLCIMHQEGERFIVDVIRGRTGPFDPVAVTQEYAELCKQYRIGSVTGDNYGKEWTQGAWRNTAISYVRAEQPAWQLYLEGQPWFNRGLVEIPDDPILIRELRLLERHPGNLGKEVVSHPRGAHDDRSNALFGVLRVLSNYSGFSLERMLANERTSEQQQSFAAANFQSYLFRSMGVNPRDPGRPWGVWR
jgi:Phage Terminase